MIQQNNPPKQTDHNPKRLKIFTEIYNPKKHTTNFIGLQTESINSLNETAQPPHHSSHKTTKSPKKLKEKRRYELSNKTQK